MEFKYAGESLAALVTRETFEATDRLLDDLSRSAQLTMYDTARELTPTRTGRMRNSWLAQPTSHRDDVREARISNDDPRAPLINYGTSEHIVKARPGHALATPAGPREEVHVAGVEPRHMVEHAAEVAARTIQETSLPARERWRREVEESISLNKRRLQ